MFAPASLLDPLRPSPAPKRSHDLYQRLQRGGVFTQGNVDLFYGDVWALRKLDRKASLLCALSLCHLALKKLMEGGCEVH